MQFFWCISQFPIHQMNVQSSCYVLKWRQSQRKAHIHPFKTSQESGKQAKVICPEAIVVLASQINKYPLGICMPRTLPGPWKNRRSLGLSHTLGKLSMIQSAAFMRTHNLCSQMPFVSLVFYFPVVPQESSLPSFWNQMVINKQIHRQIRRQKKAIQC